MNECWVVCDGCGEEFASWAIENGLCDDCAKQEEDARE